MQNHSSVEFTFSFFSFLVEANIEVFFNQGCVWVMLQHARRMWRRSLTNVETRPGLWGGVRLIMTKFKGHVSCVEGCRYDTVAVAGSFGTVSSRSLYHTKDMGAVKDRSETEWEGREGDTANKQMCIQTVSHYKSQSIIAAHWDTCTCWIAFCMGRLIWHDSQVIQRSAYWRLHTDFVVSLCFCFVSLLPHVCHSVLVVL